jgi:hypothetical protein
MVREIALFIISTLRMTVLVNTTPLLCGDSSGQEEKKIYLGFRFERILRVSGYKCSDYTLFVALSSREEGLG